MGTQARGWRGPGPQPSAGVCTLTLVHTHLQACTRRGASRTLTYLTDTKPCTSSLPCLCKPIPGRWLLSLLTRWQLCSGPVPGAPQPRSLSTQRGPVTQPQDWPFPNQALRWFSGSAHCCHCGRRACVSSSCPHSVPSTTATAPPPLSCYGPGTAVSLRLLSAPASSRLFPLPGKLFSAAHLADMHTSPLTQLSCYLLRASRVPFGSLVSHALDPRALPSRHGFSCPHRDCSLLAGTPYSLATSLQTVGNEAEAMASPTCPSIWAGPGHTRRVWTDV